MSVDGLKQKLMRMMSAAELTLRLPGTSSGGKRSEISDAVAV